MTAPPGGLPDVWGGVECTVNRVGDRWFDQLAWSGHDRRIGDLDLFASLGIRTLRQPVLWEHVAPDDLDRPDWRAADERLARLRDLGVRPIVGLLHHGSGPAYTSLLDPAFPDQLARFAGMVAERYPWVADFTPVNEPLTTARFGALYGVWHPHSRSDRDFVRALLNQLRGVVLSMRAIRQRIPGARLVQTEDCGRTFGRLATRPQIVHEGHRRWLTWDLLTGRVDRRHPLRPFLQRSGMDDEDEAFFLEAATPPDLIGLNYYLTSDRYLDDRLHLYPSERHGGNGFMRYADVEAVRARPAGIVGHEAHLLAAWARYGIPVALTEVHLGCTRDEQMRWLVEAWEGARRARRRGADVRAITAWSLLGSHNWDSLVTRDAGRYEPGVFDIRSPQPRPTALASIVSALNAGQTPRHPALSGVAWWRRPERLLIAANPGPAPARPRAAPVLVMGSTGTLGRAFQRLCVERGLPAYVAGRREVDITDPHRVAAILRRLQPWAVINAAGYVRVDDAERETEACRRANVTGPVNLAAACRRHRVPLVTFSSDLVFDGRLTRPYLEDDEPGPLNVYGAAKLEAEERVRELLPEALVIRTSAFFGPWDEYNFIAALFRALDDGRVFLAPHDAVVSPTYVPDLVHATLDLLVDGESGLWHLANEGAVSWFDFARAAAERSGRPVDLIAAVEVTRAWGPAARPRWSVLSSRRGRLLRPLHEALGAHLQEAPYARRVTGTDGCASQ